MNVKWTLLTSAVAVALLTAVVGCLTTRPPGEEAPGDGPAASAAPVMGPTITGDLPTAGTTFAGSQQVLASAKGGLFYLAYTRSIEGSNQLYVARSADGGVSWSDFPQISDGPTRSSNPHLVTDPDGVGLFVFWTKQMAVDEEQAEAMEYDPTGIIGVGEILPAADYTAEQLGEKEEEGEKTPPRIRQIFFSRFDGTTWSEQTQLTYGGYNGFPIAVWDSRGVLHLVWYGADGTYYQIVYTRWDGTTWRAPELVSLGYPDSIIPSLAVDARDDLHVAWYKYTPSTRSYQIHYRRHDAAEDRWSEQVQLSTGLAVAMNAATVVTPDQSVVVTYDGDLTPGGASSIYYRVRREGAWSEQRLLGRADLDAEMPTMTLDRAGVIHVLYHSVIDGQIHHTSSRDWTAVQALTTEDRNRSASAMWLGPYAPGGVTYVWTRMEVAPEGEPDRNRIRLGTLP